MRVRVCVCVLACVCARLMPHRGGRRCRFIRRLAVIILAVVANHRVLICGCEIPVGACAVESPDTQYRGHFALARALFFVFCSLASSFVCERVPSCQVKSSVSCCGESFIHPAPCPAASPRGNLSRSATGLFSPTRRRPVTRQQESVVSLPSMTSFMRATHPLATAPDDLPPPPSTPARAPNNVFQRLYRRLYNQRRPG